MAYPLIEYYYPIVTLTKKGDVGNGYYFENADAITNTKTNFAYKKSKADAGVYGTATEYYIYNSRNNNKPILSAADTFLFIKHTSSKFVNPFYVVFPLKKTETISDNLKNDRMNGGLAKSIDNLSAITATGNAKTTMNFSLESVIDSMRKFNPTKCGISQSKIENGISQIPIKDIYLIKEFIYVDKTILETGNFATDKTLSLDNVEFDFIDPTIKKVSFMRECTSSTKKVKKTLFTGLNKKEQKKNNYVNLAFMLASLLYLACFYFIYREDKRTQIFIFTMIIIFLIVIPIGITAQIYNSKSAKINVNDLRNSITFARYSIVTVAITIFAMFRKQIAGIFLLWDSVSRKIGFNETTYFGILFAVSFVAIINYSIIIFLTV